MSLLCKFTIGDKVCRKTRKDIGKVVGIIVPIKAGKAVRVMVMVPGGSTYTANEDDLVKTGGTE